MRWTNVRTIFRREVRDQFRDRRTLFMVFVMPILLYPLLGLGILQFTAALEQKPRRVVVVGAEHLPATPALLSPGGEGFNPELLDNPADAAKLGVIVAKPGSLWDNPKARQIAVRGGEADAIVIVPPDVKSRLEKDGSAKVPIDYLSTDEGSQLTYFRVREILARWNETIVKGRLAKDNKTTDYVEPVRTTGSDLATRAEAGGNVWARIFPFLLVIMSLTGAFYPSVDLCAGEKERGTMETLLISPASRTEIVMGKFFTVVLASMTMTLLNLVSMGLTGLQIARKMGSVTGAGAVPMVAPTLSAAFWMMVLLVPLSVFFSAICLALAVMAKSMKEGQYYMTPLYMVSMPLIMLTLAPGIELTTFTSIIPITGVGLLLKSLLQGDYAVARQYFLLVLAPMVIYGYVALRWAVDQFNREDVLFRESERFDLGSWVRFLIRDRRETPSPGQALLCFTIMLTLAWFAMQAIGEYVSPLVGMGVGHLIFILLPPVAMAFLLTRNPAKTLRLAWPEGRYLWLGVGLALTLNPLLRELAYHVDQFFPPPKGVIDALKPLMEIIPKNLGLGLLVFALIPSITEEVAFRGFILSGLERGYRTWTAILFSALLFGVLHVLLSLFNQLFPGTLLGIVLGLLAIRSRSLLPGVVFHLINNGLGVLMVALGARLAGMSWLFRDAEHGLFRWPIVAITGALAAWMLVKLARPGRALSEIHDGV
jgi:sodium transport system permease protein